MPESYSVNQLKTWSKCQKKYELDHVRRLMWPSNPKNFRLGKSVHQLLDYESRGLDVQSMLEATDSDIRVAWQVLQQSKWVRLPVIASEWGFSLAFQQKWIYGRIDRIACEGERIHILDWKTGTGIPLAVEEDWQTVIYLYAVYEARRDLGLSVAPEALAFTYVQVKNGGIQEKQIPYSLEFHQRTTRQLAKTFQAIETASVYRLPKTCPDRFCPYEGICGIRKTEPLSGQASSSM